MFSSFKNDPNTVHDLTVSKLRAATANTCKWEFINGSYQTGGPYGKLARIAEVLREITPDQSERKKITVTEPTVEPEIPKEAVAATLTVTAELAESDLFQVRLLKVDPAEMRKATHAMVKAIFGLNLSDASFKR